MGQVPLRSKAGEFGRNTSRFAGTIAPTVVSWDNHDDESLNIRIEMHGFDEIN